MKVFISWSGQRSHAVALVLKDWVSSVIQAARPWLSSADIQRGAQWMGDIGTQLHESTVGIFCLTANNKDAPWILFEAGAVAKGVASSRICTLLIDLEPTAVLGPLSQFNHTVPNKEDMLKLAATLNFALGDNRLNDAQLRRSFDAHWLQFEVDFRSAVENNPEDKVASAVPTTDALLYEILSTVRSLGSRVQQMEERRMEEIDNWQSSPSPKVFDPENHKVWDASIPPWDRNTPKSAWDMETARSVAAELNRAQRKISPARPSASAPTSSKKN